MSQHHKSWRMGTSRLYLIFNMSTLRQALKQGSYVDIEILWETTKHVQFELRLYKVCSIILLRILEGYSTLNPCQYLFKLYNITLKRHRRNSTINSWNIHKDISISNILQIHEIFINRWNSNLLNQRNMSLKVLELSRSRSNHSSLRNMWLTTLQLWNPCLISTPTIPLKSWINLQREELMDQQICTHNLNFIKLFFLLFYLCL